jgi:hypothetical protein
MRRSFLEAHTVNATNDKISYHVLLLVVCPSTTLDAIVSITWLPTLQALQASAALETFRNVSTRLQNAR